MIRPNSRPSIHPNSNPALARCELRHGGDTEGPARARHPRPRQLVLYAMLSQPSLLFPFTPVPVTSVYLHLQPLNLAFIGGIVMPMADRDLLTVITLIRDARPHPPLTLTRTPPAELAVVALYHWPALHV